MAELGKLFPMFFITCFFFLYYFFNESNSCLSSVVLQRPSHFFCSGIFHVLSRFIIHFFRGFFALVLYFALHCIRLRVFSFFCNGFMPFHRIALNFLKNIFISFFMRFELFLFSFLFSVGFIFFFFVSLFLNFGYWILISYFALRVYYFFFFYIYFLFFYSFPYIYGVVFICLFA